MSSAFARTEEAEALVTRTAKHFAHKVPVRTEQDTTRIETRFGVATLRPVGGGIEVVLSPNEGVAEDLRNVIVSHLERFARAPLEWDDAGENPC